MKRPILATLSLFIVATAAVHALPAPTVASTVATTAGLTLGQGTTLEKKTFSLQMPSTWKVDDKAEDYKPESYFTLASPLNSYVTFDISAPTPDLKAMMKNVLFALDGPAVETLSKSEFKQWGKYTGQGVHLKGKITGMFPGGVRVFATNTNGYSLLVTEFYFSDDLSDVQPGFELISKSFTLKQQ